MAKSITQQVAHNSIIQFAGKIIGAVFGLVTLGIMLRYLGQEGYGEYTTVMSYLSVFSILADLGLYLVVTREISKKGIDQNKIVSNAFTIKFIASIFVLAIASMVAMFFPYNDMVKMGIIVGSFNYLFILLNQILIGIFQKYFAMARVAIGEVVSRIIWFLGVLVVVQYNLSLLWLIACVGFGNLVYFLIIFASSRKFVKIKFEFDWKVWKHIMKIAAPLAVSVVFNLVYFKVDAVLLSVMKSPRDVGIYGAPFKVLESLIAFAAIFAGLLLPLLSKFYQSNKEKFAGIFKKGTDVLIIFVIPLCAGTIYFAKEIMVLFGGSEFVDSENVLRILIVGVAAIFLSHLFGNTAIACNLQKKLMWVYIGTAIISIILNLALIPKYSYYGAAIAVTASEVIVTTVIYLLVYGVTRVSLEYKTFLKALFGTLVMLAVLFVLPDWYFLINAAIGALTYFTVVFLLKGITKETILEIINIRKQNEKNSN